MKKTAKVLLLCVVLVVALVLPVVSNAANEGYTMSINYTGTVIAGEEHDATAVLAGENATPYTNVRLNVTTSGPATPVLMAEDSLNNKIDIAQYGYWGPAEGFQVGSTFKNETPIKATFPKAGVYTIKIDLVDMNNSQRVIDTVSATITVDFKVKTVVDNHMTEQIVKYSPDGSTLKDLNITNPTKDGYTFEGWYLDSNFEDPFDESTALTDSTILYAKFVEVTEPTDPTTPAEEETTTPSEEVTGEEATGEKDDTPKTGAVTYVGIAMAVLAISTVAVITLKNKKA